MRKLRKCTARPKRATYKDSALKGIIRWSYGHNEYIYPYGVKVLDKSIIYHTYVNSATLDQFAEYKYIYQSDTHNRWDIIPDFLDC